MKFLSSLTLIAALILAGFGDVHAADISQSELASLKNLITMAYNLSGEDNIDTIHAPLSKEKALSFGIYAVYNYDDDKVKHVTDGQPVKVYKDTEPLTSYALVSVKTVAGALDRILGYKLSIDPNSNGRIYDYAVSNGNFIIGESDAGIQSEINPISVKKDDFGYLRGICDVLDEEGKKSGKIFVVAKDHVADGKKTWKILLIKEIK